MGLSIVDVTDRRGDVLEPAWLIKAEATHRQLRPDLPADYSGKMSRVFADGGRMSVAVREDAVVGVAVYRIYENTASGVHLYVDDLVTDERRRSTGVGKALLEHMETVARREGCGALTLDSATHRHEAHRFYFRERMTVVAFHFVKMLKPAQ